MSFAVRNDLRGWRAVDGPDDLLGDEHYSEEQPELPVSIGASEVDAERDRRIDAGVMFQGVMYQSRATDRENIAGAAQLGFMAVVAGAQPGDLRWSNPGEDYAWIATDNSLVRMDAQTVVAFGKVAAERKQMLVFAGRDLKDSSPIPVDYADDKWWP
ncbi:hypothetical protein [Pseudomonas sp. GZD-209]|uniref:DUF4376 domain-containing protein n=1 Tax=Pseudomonas sp. GZD-209 TaxID=3404807 RepID=UPI003BB79EB4